jgi:hypothetical protein
VQTVVVILYIRITAPSVLPANVLHAFFMIGCRLRSGAVQYVHTVYKRTLELFTASFIHRYAHKECVYKYTMVKKTTDRSRGCTQYDLGVLVLRQAKATATKTCANEKVEAKLPYWRLCSRDNILLDQQRDVVVVFWT